MHEIMSALLPARLLSRAFFLATCLSTAGFTQAQQTAVTVYNDNLALVREVRTFSLKKGESEVRYRDVAAQIDPTSVFFASLTAPEKVTILEQNYEYDLVNSAKILHKYIDRSITLQLAGETSYSGKLLSAVGGDVILQTDDGLKVISRKSVENLSFPSLPEGFVTRPTLVWKLDCSQPGSHATEIGYLTTGINWHAEYIGVSNHDDSRLELSAWVSIENNSGAAYHDAKLKLVAGDVHRARLEVRRKVFQPQVMEMATRPDAMQEKAFFEYHLYTLQRPATLANSQIKQISLFSPAHVALRKKYLFRGDTGTGKVRVSLAFENSKKDDLGLPLPQGKIRLYKRDDDKSLVFIGEDFVKHTPKDEEVRVSAGNAFDIVGERRQTERRSIGKSSWEESWEIKLRNHKEEAIQVVIEEGLNTGWEILRNSHDYNRKDAQTIEFPVSVAKDAETVVTYTVRYSR